MSLQLRSTVALSRPVLATALALALTGLACRGARAPELEQPVGETHTNASSTGGARPGGEDSPTQTIRVVIGAELRKVCGLPEAPADPIRDAPTFTIESNRLHPQREDNVKALARCVEAGKLDGDTLRIIGFADPRASTEYAYQLGNFRAAGAKQRLVDLGVSAAKMTTESLGKTDARGNDEASWSLDRRVEIHLTGTGPQPLNQEGAP